MDAHPRALDHRDVVRRASLLAALVVTALFVQAGSAVASMGFSDPFDSLAGGSWSIGDHQLGRSRLDPANAAVVGGALELRHSWSPAWLAGTPSPGAATLVDRVDVTS
jgi:hypothetical protein